MKDEESQIASVGGDVSRETLAELARFVSHLDLWNRRLNLVSKADSNEIWHRHVQDSIQLFRFFPVDARRHMDIGSGGGFPGVVLSICLKHEGRPTFTKLVEADRRKAEFLRSAVRAFTLEADVISRRVENLPEDRADVITARAVAPLTKLLTYSLAQLASNGVALFLKGRSWAEEVAAARQAFLFDLNPHGSWTSPGSAVLEIRNIRRA